MKAFIFDLETTGLLKPEIAKLEYQPRIIEIYGFIFDGLIGLQHGSQLNDDAINYLVDPERKIPNDVIKTTGITNKMVREAPLFEDIADEVIEFIEQCDRLVAHNVMFDKSVLDYELIRLDKDIKWPELICTVEHTEFLFGKRPTLSDLYRFCTKQDPPKNIHRAKADVRMLEQCYVYLLEEGMIC